MKLGMVATATLVTTIAATSSAHAATGRVYDGVEYHIGSEVGDQYLDTHAWYIAFYDTYSRDKMSAYAKLTAAELHNATGLSFVVTTTVNTYGGKTCPGHTSVGSHIIVMKLDSTTMI